MIKWNTLKTIISSIIKKNDNQEITGDVLQNILLSIVSALGENPTFAGKATFSTTPGVPDGPVWYLASDAGNYPNFNLTVTNNIGIFVWDAEASAWYMIDTGIPVNSVATGDIFPTHIGYNDCDKALLRGIYPNCNKNIPYGYPEGTSFTLSVTTASTPEGNGFHNIEQIGYSNSGDNAIWRRRLGKRAQTLNRGIWIRISDNTTIRIEDLDSYVTWSNIVYVAAGKKPLRLVVTRSGDSGTNVIGTLDMFSDSFMHQVSQLFVTNEILNADGTFDGTHTDKVIHTYKRSFAVSSVAGTVGQWSAWTEVSNTDMLTNLKSVQTGLKEAQTNINNLGSKIDTSCFKRYLGEFNMRNCREDGVYMYGTSDKPSGSRDDETFSLIVSEAGKNVTYGGNEYAYAIRQVAYSNIFPERIFTRVIFTNNKGGNAMALSEWEKVSKYRRQEENNVDYFSTGSWFITDEVHAMNPYPHFTRFTEKDERNYLVLKIDHPRISEACERKSSGLYIKFYRWLSRRNTSRRWNLKNGEKPAGNKIPKIQKYGPGWVAMPAHTQLGHERAGNGLEFKTIFGDSGGYYFAEFSRQQKLELKCVQQDFNCLVKSHTYRTFGAQYGINLSHVFNGYYDTNTGEASWGLKRMILSNFIPSVGALSWGRGKEKLLEGSFSGSYLRDYNRRYTVMIGLQLEYRDPDTSEVTKVSPLLPFRVLIYSSRDYCGDEDLEAMFEGDIRIDINPANKGYI